MSPARRTLVGGVAIAALTAAALVATVAIASAQYFTPAPAYRGKTLADWRRELAAPAEDARAKALFAIGKLGADATSAVPDVVAVMGADASPEVRAQAARALGTIGAPAASAVPQLVRRFADPDARVRERAAWAVGEVGAALESCVSPLAELAADPDPRVRARALEVLGKAGPVARPAARFVTRGLGDPQPGVRVAAAIALGELAAEPVAAVASLRDALERDPDPGVRAWSAWAIGRYGPFAADAAPSLLSALRDDAPPVSEKAGGALAALGAAAEVVVPGLVEVMTSTDVVLRRRAEDVLVSLGEVSIPALRLAAGSPVDRVRDLARQALARIESARAKG